MNKVAIAAIGLCVVLSGCRTSKQGYVSRGNKLFNAGKYAEAEIEYRKAAQKDTNYGEAYYRLGLTELKLQNPGDAQRSLLRAVQLLPDNIDAKEKLGNLMLEYYMLDPRHSRSYYDTVQKVSDELLKKDPHSIEGLREKAILASMDQKPKEAIALLEEARKVKPNDPGLLVPLAEILIQNGQTQEAEGILKDVVSRDKSMIQAYDALYKLYTDTNRAADAENVLKSKVANNPKIADYVIQLAAFYVRTQRPTEMKTTLQRLLDSPKDFPQGRMWVGDFYMKLRDYPEAVRYYQDGVRNETDASQKTQYQKRASNALVAMGKTPEAAALIDQIVQENPKDDEAQRIKANLLLRSGKPENVQAAGHQLEDLAKRNPNDASVWLGLGQIEQINGDVASARKQYLEAIHKNGNYLPARYSVAEIGLLQSNPNETLQQTAEILKIRPGDPRARLLRAKALMQSGNPVMARSELASLTKDLPKDPEPQVQLGLLAIAEKKYSEAIDTFTKLKPTGDSRAAAGLAAVYSAQGQYEKALQTLRDATKTPTSNPWFLDSQIASTAALAGQYDYAINEFKKLLAANPKSLEQWLRLGETYELKGDYASSIEAFQQALQLSPNELRVGLALANALVKAGHTADARAQFQASLKAHPDDGVAMNNYAYFLAQNGGDLDEALRMAQRAIEKTPGHPDFSDTIGCIYLKKGLSDSALKVFGNLVQKYPNYPTFHYHLGMALLEKGDKSKARKELEAALASHPKREDEAQIRAMLGKIG